MSNKSGHYNCPTTVPLVMGRLVFIIYVYCDYFEWVIEGVSFELSNGSE